MGALDWYKTAKQQQYRAKLAEYVSTPAPENPPAIGGTLNGAHALLFKVAWDELFHELADVALEGTARHGSSSCPCEPFRALWRHLPFPEQKTLARLMLEYLELKITHSVGEFFFQSEVGRSYVFSNVAELPEQILEYRKNWLHSALEETEHLKNLWPAYRAFLCTDQPSDVMPSLPIQLTSNVSSAGGA